MDEAGNPKLRDIGLFLKSAIKKAIPDADVKYIDPSNMVQVGDAAPAAPELHAWCGTSSLWHGQPLQVAYRVSNKHSSWFMGTLAVLLVRMVRQGLHLSTQ